MKFRKKPVVIEAWLAVDLLQWATHAWRKLPNSIKEAYDKGNILFKPDGIDIHTLEGWLSGKPTDWIIRGIKGEFYPCKPDIFETTYEKVEE